MGLESARRRRGAWSCMELPVCVRGVRGVACKLSMTKLCSNGLCGWVGIPGRCTLSGLSAQPHQTNQLTLPRSQIGENQQTASMLVCLKEKLHNFWEKGATIKQSSSPTQCTPKVSLLVGLKHVQTKLLSFYVTLIHKNQKELNPKIGGLLRYWLNRVVKSL